MLCPLCRHVFDGEAGMNEVVMSLMLAGANNEGAQDQEGPPQAKVRIQASLPHSIHAICASQPLLCGSHLMRRSMCALADVL
jgi:hypothetical protein